MSARILIIDDSPTVREKISSLLAEEGYEVFAEGDAAKAIESIKEIRPDLVILDIMLPDMDGFQVCKVIRQTHTVPIIMLTARTTDQDKLDGLDLGADDYVTKPFSPRELAARVRAILRRLPGERGPDEVRCGELIVNFARHEAVLRGRLLNLTIVEFKLLGVLNKEPGRVFSRAQLIEKALGYDFEGFDRTVDVHVLNLRRKLEPDPDHPEYIKTVYGTGYRFLGGQE